VTPQVNTNVFNFAGLCFAESGSLLLEVAVAALLFEVAVAGYYLKLRCCGCCLSISTTILEFIPITMTAS